MDKKNSIQEYKYLIWGGGLFQIIFGIGLILIYKFVISIPMGYLYPFINETILLIIQFLGWFYFYYGIAFIIISFLLKSILSRYKSSVKLIKLYIIFSSILLFLVVPIGTLIGIVLLREFWMLKEIVI